MADNNDGLRSLTAAEVLELVEWLEAQVREARHAAQGASQVCDFGIALFREEQERTFAEALAKLREIAAREVLVWAEDEYRSGKFYAHFRGVRYLVARDLAGRCYGLAAATYVTDNCGTLDAAKAACERHARGQG